MAADNVDQQDVIILEHETEAPIRIEADVPATIRSFDTLASDYAVYLQQSDFDIGEISDLVTFKQAIESKHLHQWKHTLIAELKSMQVNDVWTLVEPLKTHKLIGCKWVFKIKTNANGCIERTLSL
jgi:uncharacterized protein (DUF3820 family)